MPTSHARPESSPAPADLARGIRESLARLEDMDRETAGYLKALAFIMHRVADADRHVSESEVRRMESILVRHASLSLPEAVLTVEIARHCREIADCGLSYDATRRLRARLDPEDRRRLAGFLASVARADGDVQRSEIEAIRQISTELGVLG